VGTLPTGGRLTPDDGLDRGRVFADLACATADGTRAISDFRVMGDQEVFRQVVSVPTASRASATAAAAAVVIAPVSLRTSRRRESTEAGPADIELVTHRDRTITYSLRS
jgi:hypothetical protein